MPSPLRDRSDSERAATAAALADYLCSFAASAPNARISPAPEPIDAAAIERGKTLFHQVGCVACHAPRDAQDREIALPGSLLLSNLGAKYRPAALRAFLLDPESVRPESRMPNLRLTPTEAHELTGYLLASASAPPVQSSAIDPQRVALGRSSFAELGCAACHELTDAARSAPRRPKSLGELAGSGTGCSSDDPGPWPAYSLSSGQRDDIAVALASLETPFSDAQRIDQQIASRNCTACHIRGESGDIRAQLRGYFTTNDLSLGEHGRVPPALTLVGAKLQLEWLIDAIAHGQAIRPYLNTRMPGFGTAFAKSLGERLARVDTLPPLALPEDLAVEDERHEATRELGCDLVGDKAMSCISCHTFAGERAGPIAAVDLVDSTAQRLRREWFHHFLLKPSAIAPGTLMPEFYVNGMSTRPNFGDGTAVAQIDAMWEYLAEGRNTRKPSGLRHLPIELEVAGEAVILRRSAQDSGKRAIAVGYPSGINLTFDAENLSLNQIWWGRFLDASGVWYGQGSGETRPLSDDLAKLPKETPFATLPGADAPWPTTSRRESGAEWRGYDLDALQRPTFRYVVDGIAIEDTPLPVPPESPGAGAAANELATLRRTLRFTAVSSAPDATLSFLAARDARIEELRPGELAIGESLRLGLPDGSYRIRRNESASEVVIAISLATGRADLVIEYRWQKDGK